MKLREDKNNEEHITNSEVINSIIVGILALTIFFLISIIFLIWLGDGVIYRFWETNI